MSTAFPINLFGHHCYTSEHLFIALRFSGYPDIQQKVLEYKNSMWCKKTFINSKEYESYQHPHWRDNYFDIEVMKYIINLKYQQNEGFRVLLNETKGKIIVEDTTMQNSSNSALRWGCQDLQKRDLIKLTRKDLKAFISETLNKEKKKQTALKKPRTETAQKRQEQKQKNWEAIVEKVQDVYEQALLEHCHYTLSGENALGKILTVIRDQGYIDYHLDYPLC